MFCLVDFDQILDVLENYMSGLENNTSHHQTYLPRTAHIGKIKPIISNKNVLYC